MISTSNQPANSSGTSALTSEKSDSSPSTRNTHCRSCGHSELVPIVSLGDTPLANALLTADTLDAVELRFPLDLVFCPACSLLQITETVRPEILFSDYLYLSSFSNSFLGEAERLATHVIDQFELNTSSLVIEVASNDGYLLRHYLNRGVPVLGIDPAKNVADIARQRGIPTRAEFFGKSVAEGLIAEGLAADVVHANNVLAHVADLTGVADGIAALLKPTGVAIIEVPYARDLIERCEFDTIYHEHLCYFSVHSAAKLFERAGLTLWDVEKTPFHGGTIRLYFRHAGIAARPSAAAFLESERSAGMLTASYYAGFSKQVETIIDQLPRLLRQLKADGKRVAAYGASAKGATLLNVSGVGRDLVDFVADRSTLKQGRFTPGVHLPIVPPGALLEQQPDYVLLLAWNFADEIIAEQHEFIRRGGRFIVPVPDVRIV